MKKKHYIGWVLASATAIFLITHSTATAADKVVVIPLESGNGESGAVATVTSVTGRIWMDRNLGAHRVAIKSDDPQAYGSLYQWGRLGDGHEYRESPVTTTLSAGDVPGHDHFITAPAAPYDWLSSPNDTLWQGESGINNPCPAGFRLPTRAEWVTETATWSPKDAAGAFASPLKLVKAGLRPFYSGILHDVGGRGDYWSSTAYPSDSSVSWLHISFSAANDSGPRAYGYSVRCIKD